MDKNTLSALLILFPAILSLPLAISGHDSGLAVGPSSVLIVISFVTVVTLSQAVSTYIAHSDYLRARLPDPQKYLLLASLIPVIGANTSATPLLDDDLYRYLWDGFVGSMGKNPLQHPPSGRILGFPETIKAKIAFQTVSSVYPPLAQWLFTGFWSLFGGDVRLWKFGFAVISMLTLLVYLRMAAAYQISRAFVWLILYQMLFFKEFVDSCHIDILALLFLGLSIIILSQAQRQTGMFLALAGFLAGCACLVKPLAGFVVLLFPRLALKQKLALGSYSCFFALMLLTVYFDSREQFFGYIENLRFFQQNWVFNPGVADLIHYLLRLFDPKHIWPKTLDLLSLLSILLAISGFMFQVIRPRSSATTALFCLGSIIVVQGLVNSWYIYWLWPFILMQDWDSKQKKTELITLPWIVLPSFVAIGGYPFWIDLSDFSLVRYVAWALWFTFAAITWTRGNSAAVSQH